MNSTEIIIAIIGSSAFTTIVNYILSFIERRSNTHSNFNGALRLLMKDRLRFLCAHYIQQGWIYEDELDDLISMHNCYHDDLKGNGFLDTQMQRVKSLDIKGIGVK